MTCLNKEANVRDGVSDLTCMWPPFLLEMIKAKENQKYSRTLKIMRKLTLMRELLLLCQIELLLLCASLSMKLKTNTHTWQCVWISGRLWDLIMFWNKHVRKTKYSTLYMKKLKLVKVKVKLDLQMKWNLKVRNIQHILQYWRTTSCLKEIPNHSTTELS